MSGKTTVIVRLVVPCALAGLTGCSHDAVTDPKPSPDPDSAAVSEPVHGPTLGSRTSIQASVAAASQVDPSDVVYVSLPAGASPNGDLATVRNTRTGNSAVVHLSDGGFDPVPMAGRAGDTVEVNVSDRAGAPVYLSTLYVPVRRPPRIVHSIPQRGKTDSPLNTHIIVVFSEPIDGSTVNAASIQLHRGGTAVAGTVKFLDPSMDANHVRVAFVPDAPLIAHTQYELEVTTQVRDLSGDALVADVRLPFATGESLTGAPASIRVVPDSMLQLVVGDSYQLMATVLDAAGNALTDQPVTWSSGWGPGLSAACQLTVSATGLLTAVAEEPCRVTASVADVSKGLTVVVRPKPSSVTLSPTPTALAAGDTIFLSATVRDAAGNIIPFPLTWQSSNPSVATVQPYGDIHGNYGLVTGVTPGNVTITATTGGAGASSSGTAAITIGPARAVASVQMSPMSTSLVAQGKAQVSATLFDANGKLIYNRPVSWASSDVAVATVDANGVLCPTNCVAVKGVGLGSTQVTATSGGVSGTTTVAVTTLTFASVSAGFDFTCAVATNNTGWCWGADVPYADDHGLLGNGTNVRGLASSLVPVTVSGGLDFSSISAGFWHTTCGVTTGGAVYCWGDGALGMFGDGTGQPSNTRGSAYDNSAMPVALSGGLSFSMVSVGSSHVCGVTVSHAAYCWGRNADGELGAGTTSGPESCYGVGDANPLVPCSTTPIAVVGGLSFAAVSAGDGVTCGLTMNQVAYCWGRGALGNESITSSAVPVPVSGGLRFTAVFGKVGTSCGLATDGAAYCWGSGPLGDGTTQSSAVPVKVTGGLTFTALAVGVESICGIATGGALYCWGAAVTAHGSAFPSLAPVAASGSLTFTSITLGYGYSVDGYGTFACGMTTSGVVYCWGPNYSGELGNGTKIDATLPVKVAGQP